MKLFLLVYDRQAGALLHQGEYDAGDRNKALQDRAARELEERDRPDIEVVVLAADSLDALRRTHRRYFETFEQLHKSAAR